MPDRLHLQLAYESLRLLHYVEHALQTLSYAHDLNELSRMPCGNKLAWHALTSGSMSFNLLHPLCLPWHTDLSVRDQAPG